MAGLTEQGFQVKSYDEIRENLETRFKTYFGAEINTSVGSRFGTLIDIFSYELADTWLALQADYISRFRPFATGNNLDNVGSLTNTPRKTPIAGSVSAYLGGDIPGLIIPGGVEVVAPGNDNLAFTLDSAATISKDCTLVLCDQLPSSGNLILSWQGDPDITIPARSSENQIVDAIVAGTAGITANDITVVGNLDTQSGFHFSLANNPNNLVFQVHEDSNLLRLQYQVTAESYLSTPFSESMTAVESIGISVPPFAVDTISNPLPGWKAVANFEQSIAGQARETDPVYRARMSRELQAQGTATVGGFREQIASLSNVSSVNIVENNTDTTVGNRPPHSFECYVDGGSDDEVAQAIYDYKPLGIRNVSTLPTEAGSSKRSGTYTDVNGKVQQLVFSSTVESTIRIQIVITTDETYSSEGDNQIKSALLNYLANQGVGQTVFLYKLYSPVTLVTGVITANITIAYSDEDLSTDNVEALPYEILVSNEDNITIVQG